MNIFRTIFVTRGDESNATPIDDYFKTQRFFLLFIGVVPSITTDNLVLQVLLNVTKRLWQSFIILVMLHVTIVFCSTFYLEYGSGSFARISFALSQIIIFAFATFALSFTTMRANAIRQLITDMNRCFRYRSAKGNSFSQSHHFIMFILINFLWSGLTFVTSRSSWYWSSVITTWFLLASETSVLQWAVYPFFTKERTLPLPAWYPFDTFVRYFGNHS